MKLPRQIYAILHEPTQKRYIGSSANVQRRFQAHMSALLRRQHPVEDMQADFDRYGGAYSLTVLGEIRNWDEKEFEYGWMIRYATYDRQHGYNYKDPAMTRLAAEGSRMRAPDVIARITRNWED